MAKNLEFALDIETTGLSPWHGKVLLITIRNPDGKLTQLRGSEIQKIKALKPFLEDPNHTFIIHNSTFDCTWIAVHYGIFIAKIFDTKLIAQIIQGEGEFSSSSLKTVLAKYKLADLDKTAQKSFIGMKTENFSVEQLIYAALDVEHLHALKKLQLADADKMNLLTLCELENKTAVVTYNMRVNGMKFDRKRWLEIATNYQKRFNDIKAKLDKHFGEIVTKKTKSQTVLFDSMHVEKRDPINWTSPAQVKKIFPIIKSFDDLPYLRGKDQWLDLWLDLWNIKMYVTTYSESWLETEYGSTIAADGRVHTELSQIVSTGRYASSMPNMQNIPKSTEHRSAFIAETGNVLVSGDFSGQELGIMAYASNEVTWLDAIKSGKDVHSIMATKFFPDEWRKGTEKNCTYPKRCKCVAHNKIRTKAKEFNFGLPYGKSAKSLALSLSMDRNDAQDIIDQYNDEAPALIEWLQINGAYAIRHHVAYTLPPFNRYRNLKNSKEDWHRRNQGYNTPVQGTGGDMLKLALVYAFEAAKQFKTVKILLCVHDEIITECSTKESKKWSMELKHQMERAAELILDKNIVIVEPKISTSWG